MNKTIQTAPAYRHGVEHKAVITSNSNIFPPELPHRCYGGTGCECRDGFRLLCRNYLRKLTGSRSLDFSPITWIGFRETKTGLNTSWLGSQDPDCIHQYLAHLLDSPYDFKYTGISRTEVFVNLPPESLCNINQSIEQMFSSPLSLYSFHPAPSGELHDSSKEILASFSIESLCLPSVSEVGMKISYNLKIYRIPQTPDYPSKVEMCVKSKKPMSRLFQTQVELTVAGFLLSFCKWLDVDPLRLHKKQIGYAIALKTDRGAGRNMQHISQAIYWAENVNRDSNWIIDYATLQNCINLALCRPLTKCNFCRLLRDSPFIERAGYGKYRAVRFPVLMPKKAVQEPDCLLSLVS